MTSSRSPNGTAGMLIAWSVAFGLLTLLAGVGSALVAGVERKALPSVISAIGGSPALLSHTIYYVAVYLSLHVLAAVIWSWAWAPVGERLRPSGERRPLALLSFLPLPILLLLANTGLYPASSFSPELAHPAGFVADVLRWILSAYVAVVLAAGAWTRSRRTRAAGIAVAGVAALSLAWWTVDALRVPPGAAARDRPDVVFIGIDGLRPDHVDPALTPALDDLVAGGVRVEHAWTPLARTFPAWVSVLTGQYPSTHGAYFNLMRRDLVDDSGSLAHQLGELGYQRLYAIDETRFSNMDTSFGFDRMVGPPIGGFDFMMSVIGDLPLVNLLAGTRAGKYLFPYAHGNRALASTYRPEVFDSALARALHALDVERPLFLVAHFELPHWPFTWAGAARYEFDSPPHLSESSTSMYRRTVARADAQVAALLDVLEATGRLEDAILVVLSDHGQAFRIHEPAWRSASDPGVRLQPHAGHGTHVMSVAQYRVVLAFRGYGRAAIGRQAGTAGPVTASLVDVRPTVHDWLGIAAPGSVKVDGESLWPLLSGGHAPDDRAVMLETGFSPPSVAAGSPDAVELVTDTARHYELDADGRLHLRPGLLQEIRGRKQRAVVTGAWILAALPASGTPSRPTLVLGDLDTLRYIDLRSGGEVPDGAPLPRMLARLCGRDTVSVHRLDACRGPSGAP